MCSLFRTSLHDRVSRHRTVNIIYMIYSLVLELQGFLALAFGIWMETRNVGKCNFLQDYFAPIHLMLSIGALVLIINIVNVLTVLRVSVKYSIRRFVFVLVGLVVLEVVAMVLATVYSNKLNNRDMMDAMRESGTNIIAGLSERDGCWISLQPVYECCGTTAYSDWVINGSIPNSSNSSYKDVFDSCSCTNKACVNTGNSSVFESGCHNVVSSSLSNMYTIIRGCFTVFVILQIVCYLVMYSIYAKLNNAAIVDVYKQSNTKPASVRDMRV